MTILCGNIDKIRNYYTMYFETSRLIKFLVHDSSVDPADRKIILSLRDGVTIHLPPDGREPIIIKELTSTQLNFKK